MLIQQDFTSNTLKVKYLAPPWLSVVLQLTVMNELRRNRHFRDADMRHGLQAFGMTSKLTNQQQSLHTDV